LKAKKEIIFEIEDKTIEAFLKCVEESIYLTSIEKEMIREDVPNCSFPEGYSHIRLIKYKQDRYTYIEVNMLYPHKLIEKDSVHSLDKDGFDSICILDSISVHIDQYY